MILLLMSVVVAVVAEAEASPVLEVAAILTLVVAEVVSCRPSFHPSFHPSCRLIVQPETFQERSEFESESRE